ncbi:MAG: hypothetical protein LBS77_02075 [Desulfovibrio sp.]|nr:hypothetical protein [Desulfovibrio sp.]
MKIDLIPSLLQFPDKIDLPEIVFKNQEGGSAIVHNDMSALGQRVDAFQKFVKGGWR